VYGAESGRQWLGAVVDGGRELESKGEGGCSGLFALSVCFVNQMGLVEQFQGGVAGRQSRLHDRRLSTPFELN
jgi:hypothetical protein